jgi:hypothetical protein
MIHPLAEGIGLRHLYVEQGYLKTFILLPYLRQHGRLGPMMCVAIQWTQVIAGVDFFLMQSANVFFSLCDFLADFECTFEIANT